MTKAAIFVGERRWNLRLKDGLDIRLPEQDVGNALAMLSRLDKEDKLFSRDIVAVDMRLPDRLVVQLSDDAAKAREDQFKDKKKKKAGDRRMTGLDRTQTPKTRPMPHKRGGLVACLDIGTSKIACMIARLRPSAPSEALRGRTHAVELIGYSQIQSRGMKAGAVIDLAECEQAVRQAVGLAEKMAKVRVESVLLSVSGGRLSGQLVEAAADIRGGAVTPADVSRVTSTGMRHATGEGRTVLHALPVGYTLDGVKGIRDPRGMVAHQFGVDMNVVTCDATVARNLMLAVERCHLNVEAMAASPYVAGLSVLTDDEADLGAAVVEMGAGTTTIAVYSGGRFVHAAGFAVGGQHITMDLARGLSATIADAERIKTLYGTVLTGGSDSRELMSVPTAGDEQDLPQIVSRATIANIVKHRAEEVFEMVRDKLKDSPFASEPNGRVVLSRRRLAAHRPRRTRHTDSRPARAGRTSARFRPAAQRGEERRVRGAGRAPGLPAICSSRTCRTAAYAAAGQDRDGRLFRKGRTMATRGLLMNRFRNLRTFTNSRGRRPGRTHARVIERQT